VGEVVNVDVDPADVTVNAQLRGTDGALLAGYDAAQVIVHKLLPGERTPFRIDFESVAGTVPLGRPSAGGTDAPAGTPLPADAAAPAPTTTVSATTTTPDTTSPGAGTASSSKEPGGVSVTSAVPAASAQGPVEFDPAARYPLALPSGTEVASVDVYARAVVTTHETDRGLQVLDAHVERAADGSAELVGELRNDATIEAAVPQLLVSYVDPAGAPLWVDGDYLPHSLRPQRSEPFRLRLRAQAPGAPSEVPTRGYPDGGDPSAPVAAARPPMVALPGWPADASTGTGGHDAGPVGLNVTASAYYRAPET
jgi:hypothetical protein